MSLKILGPRPYFWQWDSGQKLVVGNDECGEVHFCNGTDDCALVVAIKTEKDGSRTADVPNILLQIAKPIRAYLFQRHESGAETRTQYVFQVMPRKRPADYVYTETEVLSYSYLNKRLEYLEGEGLAEAVEDYLRDHPDAISGLPKITDDAEGKYLQVKNGVAIWGNLEIPEQYGLVTYDQDKTITIT